MAELKLGPPFLYADGIVWPVVCTAVVAARFVTRKTQGNRYGIDDWLVLPALILIWGLGVALITTTALKASGYPTPVSSPDQSLEAISTQQIIVKKLYVIFAVCQTAALGFIKLSCLFFYRRIFRTGSNRFVDFCLIFLMVTVAIWMVSFCFAASFQCGTHFEYLWGAVEDLNKCPASSEMISYGYAYSDVVTDFLTLVFPIPLVWQLHMSIRRKLAVSAVFILGSLAIATSITRLVILSQDIQDEFQEAIDQDYLTAGQCWLMLIEAGFALCAICLPTLSSTFDLKGVQTFFNNISNIFSVHSRSQTSRASSERHNSDRGSSSHLTEVPSHSSESGYTTRYKMELLPLPKHHEHTALSNDEKSDGMV